MENIGYTCFVNKNWEPLAEILMGALNVVSKYKVELFTINFDTDMEYPNIIKRRIDVNIEDRANICYAKLYASFSSEFDFGLIMDADMIPNVNIDELLEKNYTLYKDSKYPICAHHPHNPWKEPLYKDNIESLKKILNIKEITIPYKYGSYFFTKNSKEFFKECYQISNFLKNKIIPFSFDETIMNLLLNKYNATNQLDYNYLPNYWLYDEFLFGDKEKAGGEYTKHDCPVYPYIFHGCKNPNEALKISNIIIKNNKE